MAKNNKKSEIDEIVNEYFQILEEDLGLSYIYQDLPDNEVNQVFRKKFSFFKKIIIHKFPLFYLFASKI